MNKCPFNKTDSWKCHWKYVHAMTPMCTYGQNTSCPIPCEFGQWELISIGNNYKVYYDKERGMYKVEFSNGQSCIFDEY